MHCLAASPKSLSGAPEPPEEEHIAEMKPHISCYKETRL